MPRLFKEQQNFDLDHWRLERDNAINTLTYNAQTNLDPNSISKVSHKLFLIRRQDLDETKIISSRAIVSIITPHIEKKLARKVAKMELEQVFNLYSLV